MALASLYMAYQEEAKWLDQIIPFLNDPHFFSKVSQNLQAYCKQIIGTYIQTTQRPFLGNKEALEKPDLITVLGTTPPHLEERLELALSLIQRFPNTPIILSGGGRMLALEVDSMEKHLLKKGVSPQILHKESASLDTKGNAVFSKFLMREQNLEHCKNILLVTSDYHGPRALHYFQGIFGSDYAIAAALSPSQADLTELEQLIQAEMLCLARFTKETCTLSRYTAEGTSLAQSLEGDEISIFYQMLTHDPLYQARWDLARRYAHLTSLKLSTE